jgi:hypothetical protein
LLAGIGDLPDTVRDRSIEIEMMRKRPEEKVKRLRRRDGSELHQLNCQIARWVQDNLEKLRNANPEIPGGLHDRAADAWEPLIAIADLAGGDWPQRSRNAALLLSGEGVIQDNTTTTILFGDIKVVLSSDLPYVTRDGERQMTSEKLAGALVAIEEHPWAEFGRSGKPITKYTLARLLRPYKIRPATIRIGPAPEDTAKGYKISQFTDAFARYLPVPSTPTVTPSQSDHRGVSEAFQSVTTKDVTASNGPEDHKNEQCDVVTVSEEEKEWTL